MKFPQTLPDIRDEMQKLNFDIIQLLDPENPRDLPELAKIVKRMAQLASALTEAIVNQARVG